MIQSAGRQSTSTLGKPIFHMGASFDDKDEEEEYEMNGSVSNNNSKSVRDENIPLVPRK